MAAALQSLDLEDLNRARNKKASDKVIPFVFETVIAWGCPKDTDESFLTYYNRVQEQLWEDYTREWEKEKEKQLRYIDMTQWPEDNKEKAKKKITIQLETEKAKKRKINVWTQEEEENIDQDTCVGLDATILHKLVPTICDGIGRYDPKALSSTKIELYLSEVKNTRNDICHDPKFASISGTILDDLQVSAINVFMAAGVLYAPALDQQTVNSKVDELKERLGRIKTEVLPDEQQWILLKAKEMSEDGKAEMRAAVELQDTDALPLGEDKVKRMDVFHSVDLLIKIVDEYDNIIAGTENNENDKTNRKILSYQLIKNFEGSNVLCEGQPGTGKTTLLKALREDFVATTDERFCGVRKFDLLMYMECRNNSITTIDQLLKHHFPQTSNQLTTEEAVKVLRELKLLICVDGLDELTFHTKKLLKELISMFGSSDSATFIFTSRPGQARSVSLRHGIVTLQPIEEEAQQVEFLRRYQARITGLQHPDLIETFESLNETCKAVIHQPAYLALFCALFRKSPQAVKKWKNEVTLLNDFLRLSKQTMIERMDATVLVKPEDYADGVTTVIFDLSLCLLQKEEMTLTVKTYTNMCRDIFKDVEVEYYPIVSTFFTKHPNQQEYEFDRKSHTEFLAAKAIALGLASNPAAGVVSTIQEICSKRSHYFQDGSAPSPAITDGENVSLKRFENVLRFVCMLIHEDGPPMKPVLERFLKEVCPALAWERVGLDYWTDLVLGCPDSDQIAQAAAEAARTVSGVGWKVGSSRAMIATSKMLRYRQPSRLVIEPPRGEDYQAALAVLLKAVTRWYTGDLTLILNESHANYSACNASLACLKSARCELDFFKGCLSGGSSNAWRALIGGVEGARRKFFRSRLHISLLNPKGHELGQLDGKHILYITARPPSSLFDRRRRPLPTSTWVSPHLRVECRPAAGGGATGDMGAAAAALIEDIAPEDKKYYNLFLLHYPGADDELDGMTATLLARGVRTRDSSSTRAWEEAGRNGVGDCVACGCSSHESGERCVRLVV